MSDYHNPPEGPHGYAYTPPQPQRRKGLPWWGWLLIVLGVLLTLCMVVGAISSAAGDSELTRRTRPAETTQPVTPEPTEEAEPAAAPEPEEPELSVSQEQAIISAESYLTNLGGFSRSGLIGQLEYEGFSTSDAEFAVDFVEVDWMEQAAIAAESYMENIGGFSRQSLIDQLEYEGFTSEQAEHGADEVGL